MATTDNPNNGALPVEGQVFSTPASMRDSFTAWLYVSNAKRYHPQAAISCLDRISEYVVSKKISCNIWEISKPSVFQPVYRKVLESKLLRIIERNTYKTFTVVGRLYMKFLKEMPWEISAVIPAVAANNELPIHNQVEKDNEIIDRTEEPIATSTGTFLFRKDVDLSLLKYGFTIPQSAINAFCANVRDEIPRGGSCRISLVVDDEIYPATLCNVGFADNTRQQIQVRYSQTSPIANALRSIFAGSYDLFAAGRQPENIEHIEVASVFTNGFKLLCHPSRSASTVIETEYKNNNDDRRKYAPLKQWLVNNGNEVVRMSFSDIADLVGGLPPSAYQHRAFWSNTNSHPFSVAWMEAGYKVVNCDLQSQYMRFAKAGEASNYTRSTSRITIKAAMIEYSNTYVGKVKTRKEICDELTGKYGFPTQSILPADYEVSLSNPLPKLFRRIGHGAYECLGYGENSTAFYRSVNAIHNDLSEADQKRAKHIVASKFKSGYRVASSIDFERFKTYYADEYDEDIESDADELDMFMKSVALIYDDRAYMYDDETVNAVRVYLEQTNSPCIYIVAFFEKFSCELYTFGIFSVDMLKAFIEKNYADAFCKRDYVYLQPDASPFDLIRQVFDERETWSFDDLFVRLPWLKQDTIRAALNGSDYHRIETGIYTHVDNMDLPDGEGEKVVAFVWERLQSKDYVIANELDLSRFEALNPHCPFSAIRDAVFNKFLSNRFSKSGQVITRIGKKLRVLDILEQYCCEAETASFEELNSFEATFDPDGRTHSQCLVAAHNVMVRVSADLFVAESMVSFDIEKTDEAIALYCRDNFIPLKNVVDFSLFPYAGYPWNLFLLESYVRKFSRVFKYDVRAVNSANIGAIVRKSFTYGEYDDILAVALVKSPISLNNKKAVGDYLFDNGYIGWRNLGKSESKILATAKKLREGGAV